MSATKSLFGASATNLRSTRSGAGRASRSRTVVRIPLRRLAPWTAVHSSEERAAKTQLLGAEGTFIPILLAASLLRGGLF